MGTATHYGSYNIKSFQVASGVAPHNETITSMEIKSLGEKIYYDFRIAHAQNDDDKLIAACKKWGTCFMFMCRYSFYDNCYLHEHKRIRRIINDKFAQLFDTKNKHLI